MSAQIQRGSVSLVAGQQSYDITFPVPFLAAPTVLPSVEMPNDSGEVFTATVDASSLTVNGCTVWLSGVPTAASDGGAVVWAAVGTTGNIPTPSTSTIQGGITVVELCNRVGRRARGGDFTKLSMNEQSDIIDAINSALQRLYNALPNYFKEQTQGFVLAAPLEVTGIGVTQYSKTVTGITFTAAQFGCTVVLDGDPAWNQVIGENELLNPYMGSTGTVAGTIYGDAIYSDTYPLDRIIGNPQFANQTIYPLSNLTVGRVSGNPGVPWLFQQAVGVPAAWWTQVFGNSQGNTPLMVLKFAPVPDQAYAVNVRIGFWPKRLTLADYDANITLTVPSQFIDKSLLPMALQEFRISPAWQPRNDDALIEARGESGESFARNQLGQIGSPNNRIGTPIGF